MTSFHGVEIASVTVNAIRCRTTAFPSRYATPVHAHDDAYLCLVLDGQSEQHSGAGCRRRDRGRAYFYPAGEVHSEQFGPTGSRLFSVEIGAAAVNEMRLPRVSTELVGLPALMARRLQRTPSPHGMEELAMTLVGTLSRETLVDGRPLPIARDYLHAHFREKVTLAEIASAAGVHPVHLCRAFPRRFGVTLGEYLRALRVDYAACEIVSTDKPIADIALDAGFSSQAHLTRHFTDRMGIPPAAYRRLIA